MPNRPTCHRPPGARTTADRKGDHDAERGSAASRGYDRRWRTARLAFLAEHPLCEECLRETRLTAASVVDHVAPHRGDMERFWDSTNWRAICTRHHAIKTARGE